jgi:hypothetical protein
MWLQRSSSSNLNVMMWQEQTVASPSASRSSATGVRSTGYCVPASEDSHVSYLPAISSSTTAVTTQASVLKGLS